MKEEAIKKTLEEILGTELKVVEVKDTSGTTKKISGIYEADVPGGDKYVFAMAGVQNSEGKREQAQLQDPMDKPGKKTYVFEQYEKSKQENKKFFLIAPDSKSFTCDDYYIFIELMEKGAARTCSYALNVPKAKSIPTDRVTRTLTDSKSAYITYVPAKDGNDKQTTELLKQYIYCFDSRPYSKYITTTVDFILSGDTSTLIETEKPNWPNNFLIAGAPGTGKSYKISEEVKDVIKKNIFAQNFVGEEYDETKFNTLLANLSQKASIAAEDMFESVFNQRVRRVTFYEDYSYESFVGCYKPMPYDKNEQHSFELLSETSSYRANGTTEGKQIIYSYEPGPFVSTYIDARNNPKNVYFLIIEEINRARAASVFGDMFQLLDRKNGESEYAITPEPSLDKYLKEKLKDKYHGVIKLPSNMFIWATMNNADQGVFPLDSAFKRRWGYKYLDVNSSDKNAWICISEHEEIRWNIFRFHLNQKILECATEDKCIGAWYFKDEELVQAKRYFSCDDDVERNNMINPLADKLLVYLLNDVCRMDPSSLFKEGYHNMPNIRIAIFNRTSLRDILNIDWEEVDKQQKLWSDANPDSKLSDNTVTVETSVNK